MCHKSKILSTLLPHLECSLCGIGLHSQGDSPVEDTVKNVEGLPLQPQTVVISEIMDAAAQDVVFRHNFCNIESVMDALYAVDGGTGFLECFGDRFIRPEFQSDSECIEEFGNVVRECWLVEVLSAGQ